jgi:hypothetical protein
MGLAFEKLPKLLTLHFTKTVNERNNLSKGNYF